MRRHLCSLALAVVVVGLPSSLQAQPKTPKWAYAFDLSCRKFGEAQFTKDTKKFGVEVFKDPNNNSGVFITQTGAIAVVPGFDAVNAPLTPSVAPEWISGLDLKARKAGEQEFTATTKTWSLEVFFDSNTNHWIYVVENGNIAVVAGKKTTAGALQAPKWLHSVDLRCREAGKKEWTKETPAYGIEVYKDSNNGNLIYICDRGTIAVTAGSEASGSKAPDWLHGQDVQSRKFGEKDFTKETKKYGIEIFRDANNDNLVFLSETGSIAVQTGGKDLKAPTVNPKDATFTHGLDLSCRSAGERDFTSKTKTYSLEVFREDNATMTLLIAETGTIAIAPLKK